MASRGRLIAHAKSRGCCLELNAHPERLDLLDTWCMTAKEAGVLVAIDSDDHSMRDFANRRIGQARRGWLTAENGLNTRPLAELVNCPGISGMPGIAWMNWQDQGGFVKGKEVCHWIEVRRAVAEPTLLRSTL